MNKRNYHEYKAQTTNWWNSSMRLEWIKITTRQRLIGYIAVIFYYYHATKSHISYNDWSVVNDDGERKGSSGVSREVEFQHPPLLMTEGPVFRKERIVECVVCSWCEEVRSVEVFGGCCWLKLVKRGRKRWVSWWREKQKESGCWSRAGKWQREVNRLLLSRCQWEKTLIDDRERSMVESREERNQGDRSESDRRKLTAKSYCE